MSDDLDVILAGGFFSCPKCSKYYRWVEKFAGKKVRCRCGKTLNFPHNPKGDDPQYLESTPEQAFSTTIEQEEASLPVTVPEMGPDPVYIEATETSADADAEIESQSDEDILELPPELEIELPPGVEIEDLIQSPAVPEDDGEPIPDLDSGDYDVEAGALGRVQPLHKGRCPECYAPLKPASVLCLKCGFNLEVKKKLETKLGTDKAKEVSTDDKDTDKKGPDVNMASLALSGHSQAMAKVVERREDEQDHVIFEIVIPIILIGIGVAFLLLNAFVLPSANQYARGVLLSSGTFKQRMDILGGNLLLLALQIPCLFLGIFLVARFSGASFGTIRSAIFKLLGITILNRGMSAIFLTGLVLMTTGTVWLAFPMVLIFEFAVFWILFVRMFKMEFVEVMSMYSIAFLGPFLLVLLIVEPILKMF